jgi:hypothetical protein
VNDQAVTTMDPFDQRICVAIAQGKPISAEALRVLGVLHRLRARCAEEAVCDAVLAREAGVAVRNVIDLAEELAVMDVAVVATCGKRHPPLAGATHSGATQGAQTAKGRFITDDPALIREYAGRLHDRAIAVHGRAKTYSDLADRLDAKRGPVDSRGQGRLNYA